LRKSKAHFHVMAKIGVDFEQETPQFAVKLAIDGLSKIAPGLKLPGIAAYFTIADDLLSKQVLAIEGDILRLQPYVIDKYILTRAQENMPVPAKDLYFDYVVLKPNKYEQEITEVLFVWIKKSDIQPYIMAFTSFKLRLKAIELSEMSYQRYLNQTIPIAEIEGLANFANSCGAAMREWSNDGI